MVTVSKEVLISN